MKKLLIASFLLMCGLISAQTDTTKTTDSLSYYDMSLEQLLQLKAHGVPTELEKLINSLIAVASKKPLSARESPSIVTLVTRDEIRKSGARDLIDVLRLVPGLDFGVDVEGVVGLGVRGSWAHEGKTLLLIDGQEQNEILFGTTQFGNHYPIDDIERIEVIRGPGSAIYGGYAEYGVINIITRKGEDVNGFNAGILYGQTNKDFSNGWLRRNFNFAAGKKFGDFEFSLSGLYGQSHRSDRNYTDLYGDTFNLGTGDAQLNPAFLNLGLRYKNLSVRAIGDFYATTVRDKYDVATPEAYNESYNAFYTELKYNWKINESFTIVPKFTFKSQKPWNTPFVDSITEEYNKIANRTLGNITATWQVNRHINIVGGTEFYSDMSRDDVDSSFFSNGEKQVNYYNIAAFTQGLIKTRIVNVILGARFDAHNAYGNAFVPRVGLTKKIKRFHFKALYSNSFRAPSIENINDAFEGQIQPELTQVAELEAGYQITRKSFITLNFFDNTTNNPIVYYYDPDTQEDGYRNFGKSGTRGIEAEFRIRQRWGYVYLNYSFYTAAGKSRVADYKSDIDSTFLLGFAKHKINLNSSFNIAKGLSINPTLTWYGARHAYTELDSTETSVSSVQPSLLLANLYVLWDTPAKGLSVGIGTYNILDAKLDFIQPYNGYHAPLPSPSREYFIRLTYSFSKSDKKGGDK